MKHSNPHKLNFACLDCVNKHNEDDMFKKFLCWLMWHDKEIIEHHNFYKGDLGYSWRCKRCSKEGVSSGIPLM